MGGAVSGHSTGRDPSLAICGGGNAGHALAIVASQNFDGDVHWLVGSDQKAAYGVRKRGGDGLRSTGVIEGRAPSEVGHDLQPSRAGDYRRPSSCYWLCPPLCMPRFCVGSRHISPRQRNNRLLANPRRVRVRGVTARGVTPLPGGTAGCSDCRRCHGRPVSSSPESSWSFGAAEDGSPPLRAPEWRWARTG